METSDPFQHLLQAIGTDTLERLRKDMSEFKMAESEKSKETVDKGAYDIPARVHCEVPIEVVVSKIPGVSRQLLEGGKG